jgi:hypothetical protein
MTIDATIDTEFDTEIDPVWEKLVDPDESSKHELATRLVDPECPFSGPSARASSSGN